MSPGYLLATLLGLSSGQALANSEPSVPTMSLEAVYALAVDNAPSLAIARHRVDSAEALKSEARGAVLPQVSLFGEWSENTLSYSGPAAGLYADQDYSGERYGFSVRQTVFNMSRFREIQRRGALFDRSESDLALAEIELLADVTDAYLKVVIADETVNQFQMEQEALEKQLEEARALHARALMPLTQVLETQTRSETVKADLIEIQGEADIARERLTELIGMRDFELMPVTDDVVLALRTGTPQQAVALAQQNNPAVAAAKESVEASNFAVKREQGSWLPEVNLVFNQQYSDVGFDNLESPPRDVESLSIAVTYPLFQGGSKNARIRNAWAEYYAAKEELEGVMRSIETQTRSAWVKLDAADRRIVAAQQAVDTANVNVAAAQKANKLGTGRVTDVLFALAQRTGAQRDRAFAAQQRVMAWLELELITGTLPAAVAPLLSDALLRTAAVTASGSNP